MQKLSIAKKEIVHIDIDKIYPNPYQPRKNFDDISLESLALSIKKYGVIEPISVRNLKGLFYEIVSGERRFKACKKLGMQKIPAIICNVNERDSAFITLIGNIQKEGLNSLEEAESMQSLMVDFGYTQQDIANVIGAKYDNIRTKMKILSLSKDIKKDILKLSEKHIKLLLEIGDNDITKTVLDKIIKFDLNAKKTKALVEKTLENKPCKNNQKIKGYVGDIRLFTNTIKNAIDIMKQSGIDTQYSLKKNGNDYEISIKLHDVNI